MLKRCGSLPPRNSRTGSTLALSLIVVVSLVIMSGLYLQFSSAITKRQAQATDQKRSFYLAEAGLAEGFAGVRIGKTGNVGSSENPALFGNGLFWVETEALGDGQRKLSSVGMCGSASSTLDLVIAEGSSSVAALGVFSSGSLELPSGTLIDAYDSSAGPYVPPTPTAPSVETTTGTLSSTGSLETVRGSAIVIHEEIGTPGAARVSSNGAVSIYEDLGDETRVLGDLRPGPSAALTRTGSPEITGTTDPIGTSVGLPAVTLPTLPLEDGYTHESATPWVIPSQTKGYEFVRIGKNAQATITGPATLLIGELRLERGAELVLDTTGGRIDIFVTDSLELKKGSVVSFTKPDPKLTSLQFSGTKKVKLEASADFQGVIYAPSAEVSLTSPFRVFGSLIADQLTFKSAVELHFDAALGAMAEIDALPSLLSWRILQLNSAASAMGDPFNELGLTRKSLDGPALVHEDQILTLEYFDLAGVARSYDGWESDFDWDNVSQVTTIKRDDKTVGDVEGLAGIGGVGSGTGVVGNGGTAVSD